MSKIPTEGLAQRVMAELKNEILKIAQQAGRHHVHTVIMVDAESHDEGETLYNQGITDVTEYPVPYDKIASGKATLALQTELDTRVVIEQAPHLLIGDDPLFIGGIYRHGIAIGVSGLREEDDERVALKIYEALKARGILVRYMTYPEYGDGLRISVGTPAEVTEKLLRHHELFAPSRYLLQLSVGPMPHRAQASDMGLPSGSSISRKACPGYTRASPASRVTLRRSLISARLSL